MPKCGFKSNEFNFCPECGVKLIIEKDEEYNEEELLRKIDKLKELKRHDEVLAGYDKLIKMNPNNPNYYSKKAWWLGFSLELWEKAKEYIDKAIKLEPENPNHYYNKVYCLEKLKRWEDAIEPINKAIKLKPDIAIIYTIKVDCLVRLKRWEDAIEAINKAINLQPKNPRYYYFKADCLERLDYLEEAKKCRIQAKKYENEN